MTTSILSNKKQKSFPDGKINSSESIFHNDVFEHFSNYDNLYEFRSDYRLSDKVLKGPIRNFNIENVEDYTRGSAVLNVDGVKFNTFLFDSTVKKLYVSFTSGSRKKDSNVLFTRWKWRNYFDGYFLAVDDPMFEYHKTFPSYLMGWYYGTSDNNFLDKTAKLIKELAKAKGVSPENIFLLGSSSGATASLYISNSLPGCHTMAYNPQFSLPDWPYATEFEQEAGVDLKADEKRSFIRINPDSDNKYFIYYNLLSPEDMTQMHSLLDSLGISYKTIKYGLNKLADNIYLMASVSDFYKLHTTAPNEYETSIISRFLELSEVERQQICDNEFFTYMCENISKRFETTDRMNKIKGDANAVNSELFKCADQAFERHVDAKKYSDIVEDFKALFFLKSFSLPKSYFKIVARSLRELKYDKDKLCDYFESCTSNGIVRVKAIVDNLKTGGYLEPRIMNSFVYLLETLFKSQVIISKYKEAFLILCRALQNERVAQPDVHNYVEIKYAILSEDFASDDLSFTGSITKDNCCLVPNVCNLIGFKDGYSAFVTHMHDKDKLISHTIDFFFRNLLGCSGFKSVAQYKQTNAAYYYARKTVTPDAYGQQIIRISQILADIITSDNPELLIRILGNELIRLIAIALGLPTGKFLIFEHLNHTNMKNCRNYLRFVPKEMVSSIS